jgi:hypothetical protein
MLVVDLDPRQGERPATEGRHENPWVAQNSIEREIVPFHRIGFLLCTTDTSGSREERDQVT